MTHELPYVSFVVTSRNDNHGGDLTKRMVLFMRGLMHQCDKHKLRAEVVFVEWNPPAGNPMLKDMLPAPEPSSYLTVRYIVVPPEVHNELQFSERMPLFQMIAKNVGIKRSKAPFILCTNIDLLFSDGLIEYLASKKLEEGKYYRANRADIPRDIDENGEVDALLKWAEKSVIKRLGKSSFYPNFRDTTSFLFKYWALIPLFKLLSRLKKAITSPISQQLNSMDTDACGDFTLMHKNDWERIMGYPELEIYSLHIDSMGIIAASAIGIKQVILPWNCTTYHISHENGWEFKNEKDKVLFYTNKPVVDWWAVHQWGIQIMKEGRIFDINNSNWGMADKTLEEVQLP